MASKAAVRGVRPSPTTIAVTAWQGSPMAKMGVMAKRGIRVRIRFGSTLNNKGFRFSYN